MSDLLLPDRDWGHLYPRFAAKLAAAHAEAKRVTGVSWSLMEGYRSQERQSYLYAQGRTRPGIIVTWKRFPTWHGAAIAADSAPLVDGKPNYNAPLGSWKALQAAGKQQGLANPAWSKGDLGHLQWTDKSVQACALAWIRAGFPPGECGGAPPAQLDVPEIAVLLDGQAVPDACAFVREENGPGKGQKVFLWARAVLEQGGCAITPVEGGVWVHPPGKSATPVQLSGANHNGKLFLWAKQLHKLGWDLEWNAATQKLVITTGGQ